MQPKTLRVLPNGNALVQDHERLDQGTNAFIGRRYREIEPGRFGFAPTETVVEVPYRHEYVRALQAGDLLPADAATAKVVGLKFVEPEPAKEAASESAPTAPSETAETTPSAPVADATDAKGGA